MKATQKAPRAPRATRVTKAQAAAAAEAALLDLALEAAAGAAAAADAAAMEAAAGAAAAADLTVTATEAAQPTPAPVTEAAQPAPAPTDTPIAPRGRKSNSAGIAASWKVPPVRQARLTRHGVEVDGVGYRSVREAFRALLLPDSKHIAFRLKLKAAGTLSFRGRVFTLTAPEAAEF